jgi:hypothetical protein
MHERAPYKMPETHKLPAALHNYLARIGAEVRNFRKYVVTREGRDHYHYDASVISVVDGKIVCKEEEYAPTKEEAAAIELEIEHATKNGTWPRQIDAGNSSNRGLRIDGLRAMVGGDAQLFEYRDINGELNFVQQRIRKEDGTKEDFPWSYWSDGRWRMMEPDGLLPLYGLEKLKDAIEVFIHEGAKCAAAMTEEFLNDHPWKDELLGDGVAHLGWPGGAPNPHRVDWEPIRKLGRHIKVTIIADNDISGNDAVPKISRIIQRSALAIKFSHRGFPPHFDLSDAWPEGNNTKFSECVTGATWATRKSGEDKKYFELREEFISECNWIVKPSLFIHNSHSDMPFSDKEFNGLFSSFSDAKNVAGLLQKSFHARCDCLAYEPAFPMGSVALPGIGSAYNMHCPTALTPRKGDLGAFEEFLEILFPNEKERHHVKCWIATLAARLDIRMRYGLLMPHETQGIGKNTLGNIVAELVGPHNVSWPNEEQLLDKFNGWARNKRLAIIGEVYQGHSSKLYNRMKDVITDDTLDIRLMHQDTFTIKNHVHVIAFSNSNRPIKMDASDRRWYVPTLGGDVRTEAYWKGFNKYLREGGYEAILAWAKEFVKDEANIIPTGRHAPMTDGKTKVMVASLSDGEALIWDLATRMKAMKGQQEVVVRLDAVRVWLSDRKAGLSSKYKEGNYLETAETISSIFRRNGMVIPEKRFRKESVLFRVVANFDLPDSATWPDIEKCYKTPDELFDEDAY